MGTEVGGNGTGTPAAGTGWRKRKSGDLATSGGLCVPPWLDTRDFAAAEDVFREVLWPRPAAGYARLGRELAWSEDRTVLFYKIVDTPVRGRKAGEASE
jgi:hypothetical protein